MTETDSPEMAAGGSGRQVSVALATVFLAFTAQVMLNPVIAPLARELGLPEWNVGVMISVAALAVVMTSQPWARRSRSRGRKPVLLLALIVGLSGLIGFAVVALFGLAGAVAGTTLFILLVLTRGILFGLGLAAIAPTVQAYIADVTPSEEQRVRGMAGIGAAQGISLLAGAILGALLGAVSLVGPLVATPLVLVLALLLVFIGVPPEGRQQLLAAPPRVSPLDPRVAPYLVVGFAMFTALGSSRSSPASSSRTASA